MSVEVLRQLWHGLNSLVLIGENDIPLRMLLAALNPGKVWALIGDIILYIVSHCGCVQVLVLVINMIL